MNDAPLSGNWVVGAAFGGLFAIVIVANVVAAAREFYRAYRISLCLKTGVGRAGGRDALKLIPLVGGGGSLWEALYGGGDGDAGDACDGGGADG